MNRTAKNAARYFYDKLTKKRSAYRWLLSAPHSNALNRAPLFAPPIKGVRADSTSQQESKKRSLTCDARGSTASVRFPNMKYSFNLSADTLETLNDRKALLFDTSVWIRLAEGKTKESIEIREMLIHLKDRAIIFCPLSAPTIWELRKQAGESFKRTSILMEELSLNITFRGIDQIFDYEISNFIQYLLTDTFVPLSKIELFGSLLSYLSPGFHLEPGSCTEESKGKVMSYIADLVKNTSLTLLMEMVGENSSPEPKLLPDYQATNIKRRRVSNGDKNKMKRIELEYVTQSILLPKMNKQRSLLPMDQQFYIVEKVSQLPRSKKYGSAAEYIIGYLPALSSYINVFTVSGYDTNRKDNMNDYFDIQFLVYGLSYASIFVAIDRGVKNLVALVRKEGDIGFLCYSSSLQELKDRLEGIYKKI